MTGVVGGAWLVVCAALGEGELDQGEPRPSEPGTSAQAVSGDAAVDTLDVVVGLRTAEFPGEASASRMAVSAWARRRRIDVIRQLPFAVVLAASARQHLHELRGAPGVRYVESDLVLRLRPRAPTDPLYAEQWTLHPTAGLPGAIHGNVEAAWLVSEGLRSDNGSPIRVAVVDDGFDLGHTDLPFLPGQDFAAYPNVDLDPGFEATAWHGVWTSGVIGARADGVGSVGVCPACVLLPVALTRAGGPADLFLTSSSLAAALVWAVDAGADVINNSWGPPDGSPFDPDHAMQAFPEADATSGRLAGTLSEVLRDALRYAVRDGRGGLGTVVVWSAGNGGELVTYDGFASDGRVVAVAAVDSRGERAYYSDYGPPIFVAAPSSGGPGDPAVWSTDARGSSGGDPGDYYEGFGGTSAAAAHVSGVAALILAARPDLTSAQVRESLARGALPPGNEPALGPCAAARSPTVGHGILDASLAIAWALAYPTVADPTERCTLELDTCGDGRDDDCDGIVDDPESCGVCVPDAPRERCDGRDNDCDGAIDEDFVCEIANRPSCAPCTLDTHCAATASCRAQTEFPGTHCLERCESGQVCPQGFACNGEVCALMVDALTTDCTTLLRCAQPERCDGCDNDCDGLIDDVDTSGLEAMVVARDCRLAEACADLAACVDGAWACAPLPSYEADEVSCDGLDNDCDGAVDEGCSAGGGCTCTSTAGPSLGLEPAGLVGLALALRRRRRHTRL